MVMDVLYYKAYSLIIGRSVWYILDGTTLSIENLRHGLLN